MKKRSALAIVALCVLAEPVMAADVAGLYAGANALDLLSTYRRSTLDSAMSAGFGGADNGFVMGPSSIQRTHVSWDAYVGYMVTPNLGVEVSFIDLGPFRYSGFGTLTSSTDGSAQQVNVNLDVRTHGPAVAIVGALPMTNVWELDAKVGAFQAKTKSTYHTTVGETDRAGTVSESTTSLMASVGTAFNVTTHCLLRVDYLRIQKIKDKGLASTFNVDGVTAGVAYIF